MAQDIQAGQTRAEKVRRERRMKPGSMQANGIKLGLDETKLDRNGKHYRWVREDRVQQMISKDYDPVTKPVKDDGTGLGSIPTQHGGIDEAGKPYGMVLMEKYKDWFEEDQKAKQKPLDAAEEAIRRGRGASTDAPISGAYTPNDGVNIIDKA